MFARKLSRELNHVVKPYAQVACERATTAAQQQQQRQHPAEEPACKHKHVTSNTSLSTTDTVQARPRDEPSSLNAAQWRSSATRTTAAMAVFWKEAEFCMMEKTWHAAASTNSRKWKSLDEWPESTSARQSSTGVSLWTEAPALLDSPGPSGMLPFLRCILSRRQRDVEMTDTTWLPS
eukprot:gnl/TRDRNA2_/TRDRNA2_40146_c0_seq1.p1 gnl/TRDRNA2_/TRDRNA2_40146_c0~~gnl/TRDRNA2_/TRDRNA2_40146_c0_seq1.p1  ORF type:complete len:205 (-),score=33.61 gnl/TRDRNA2_/TRDRNA2_40146_c0_seq1:77-610(-)